MWVGLNFAAYVLVVKLSFVGIEKPVADQRIRQFPSCTNWEHILKYFKLYLRFLYEQEKIKKKKNNKKYRPLTETYD